MPISQPVRKAFHNGHYLINNLNGFESVDQHFQTEVSLDTSSQVSLDREYPLSDQITKMKMGSQFHFIAEKRK